MLHDNKIMLSFANENHEQLLQMAVKKLLITTQKTHRLSKHPYAKPTKESSNGKFEYAHRRHVGGLLFEG